MSTTSAKTTSAKTTSAKTTSAKTTSATQELSFLQQMEALMAATSAQLEQTGNSAKKAATSGPKPNPVWEALEPLTQAALTRAGMTHANNLLIEREGNDRTPMRNRPARMNPTTGKLGDAWATTRNKLRHYFLLSLIALAGGNKGRVALADVACLYVAFELPQYDTGANNDMNSTSKIASTLFTRLGRPIEIDGEQLEIKGLQLDPVLAQWVAPANAQIAKVKGLIRSEQ